MSRDPLLEADSMSLLTILRVAYTCSFHFDIEKSLAMLGFANIDLVSISASKVFQGGLSWNHKDRLAPSQRTYWRHLKCFSSD